MSDRASERTSDAHDLESLLRNAKPGTFTQVPVKPGELAKRLRDAGHHQRLASLRRLAEERYGMPMEDIPEHARRITEDDTASEDGPSVA